MREAAQWLIDSGKPMWKIEDFDSLGNPPEEFIILRVGSEAAATCIITFEDKFFWPDALRGESGYIHKLAARRRYAGQGLPAELVRHVANLCAEKGARFLRLDCDARRPALRSLYEGLGFRLVEIRPVNTPRHGWLDIALYEKPVTAENAICYNKRTFIKEMPL
jgi:ribosomal protein S18 acetylase RimI-like enzyme